MPYCSLDYAHNRERNCGLGLEVACLSVPRVSLLITHNFVQPAGYK